MDRKQPEIQVAVQNNVILIKCWEKLIWIYFKVFISSVYRGADYLNCLPAEVKGFFSGRKNAELKSSGRDFKFGVPSLRFQTRYRTWRQQKPASEQTLIGIFTS
jgi:hypothetical protein